VIIAAMGQQTLGLKDTWV